MKKVKIVIAGASGFIGRSLIERLLIKFPGCEITALSRTALARTPLAGFGSQVTSISCDLFSLRSIEDALPTDLDLAIYLVHSMSPTAALDQGSFEDYDLILADNFARALSSSGVHHLIYLGGLLPENAILSRHLRSRLEVEEAFREHQLPLTVFRAGLIFGDEGSSTRILLRLVDRLPWMICPLWTQTKTTPVDLDTVLSAITDAALVPAYYGKTFDLAGCQSLSYVDMMKATAAYQGKRRLFIPVLFFTPTLSRLWVSLITGAPRSLVYPLVESLKHPMVARGDHLFFPERAETSFVDLLKLSLPQRSTSSRPREPSSNQPYRPRRNTVRSVQRLALPPGPKISAKAVKDVYCVWISQILTPWIRVRSEGSRLIFTLFSFNTVLLELELSEERSTEDRQLLYIKRGLLVAEENRGRLEFRSVLRGKFVLAAIHEYRPSLPWFIYIYTQALIHLLVMKLFARRVAQSI